MANSRNIIYKIRMLTKFTQKEFGDIFGVWPTTICLWENGKTQPQAKEVKKIYKYLQDNNTLGISPNEFMENL